MALIRRLPNGCIFQVPVSSSNCKILDLKHSKSKSQNQLFSHEEVPEDKEEITYEPLKLDNKTILLRVDNLECDCKYEFQLSLEDNTAYKGSCCE